MKTKSITFWSQLESKQISKDRVESFLIAKLGKPNNQIQTNLLAEFCKKVNSYYFQTFVNNSAVFSLYGYVQEIQARKFKEGKNRGMSYYLLKLGEPKGETLKASQADLSAEKWSQLEKSALLGKKLVFEYRKWITNKELLDFYPKQKEKASSTAKLKKSPDKAETG